MPVATGILELKPADLSMSLPVWELGLPPGEPPVAVIDGSAAEWGEVPARAVSELRAAPVLTVAVVRDGRCVSPVPHACDLVVPPDEVDRVLAALQRAGAPALVAAQVLRAGDVAAVAVESLAYSTLLWSEHFAAWRATRERHAIADAGRARTRLERIDTAWVLTLTRAPKHNAFDAQMREELCDALDVIAAEPSLPVVLLGEGRSFCSGGDLDEFGTAASPLAAHLVRGARSVARRLDRLAERLVVGVHGRCIGAGIELSAFATTVIATETASFLLPELALGLNLGAGGTISLPRRIGRHRTLALLLEPEPIDAFAARACGLVDEIVAPAALRDRCLTAAEGLR
jgi:enoyl-CoA hydratase/carnithine racemase